MYCKLSHRIAVLLIILISSAGTYIHSMSLDGMWRFKTDPYNTGNIQEWWKSDFNDSGWELMKVPGNWDTTPAHSTYMGTAWYRTDFDIHLDQDRIYRLKFDGVATDADVWLNGIFLGSHDFAFTTFDFDVSDLLNPNGKNVLAVRVDNRFKVGATWSYGGIRRSVSLQSLPKEGIERILITSETDSRKKKAEVLIRPVLRNVSPGSNISVVIKDKAGKKIATRKICVSSDTIHVSFKIKNPHLWDFDRPDLYEATVITPTDTLSERFGLREIVVSGEKFILNDEQVRLCGANWVPDCRFTGNTLPEWLYRQDIDMMKEAGVNMARLSHQGLPEEVLDYIDEKGILIFEEIPLWNKNSMVNATDTTPVKWLGELVSQRINHPCIIGWSAGNEIGRHSDNPDLEKYLIRILDYLRDLDPNRLAVYVTHTAAKQPDEPAALSDVILFNQYGAHGERADRVHEYNLGKPIFYSEYGKTVNRSDRDATVDYRAMLDDMKGRDFIAGASVWTFNDYRTNYRDNSTDASGNRPWGAVDAYRRKKRAYDMLQRANSPLSEFICNIDADEVSATLRSRRFEEIPVFKLKDYRLEAVAWRDSTKLWCKSFPVQTIAPGDEDMTVKIGKFDKQTADRIELSLISPSGYVVSRDTRFIKAPDVPNIIAVETADNKCRIHFRKDPSAFEYAAECTESGVTRRIAPTIENYIEVDLPNFDSRYDIAVIASNEAGESISHPVSVTPVAAILPPAIIYAKHREDELHIAFTSDKQDYYYDIEYWEAGDINPKTLTVTTGGACVIPVDNSEKQYFIRMNRHLAYGYASPMSLTVKIEK